MDEHSELNYQRLMEIQEAFHEANRPKPKKVTNKSWLAVSTPSSRKNRRRTIRKLQRGRDFEFDASTNEVR